jgi:hypothetical protein
VTLRNVVGAHVQADIKHDAGEHVTPGLERSAAWLADSIAARSDFFEIQAGGSEDGCLQRILGGEKCIGFYAALLRAEMTAPENEPREGFSPLGDLVEQVLLRRV